MFQKFAEQTAKYVGTWWAFVLSVAVVVLWAVTGPFFNYSDTWQLVINTATTVITFWLVFIIQYTQNRDTALLRLKVDELVRAEPAASDQFLSIEDLSDAELDDLQQKIHRKRRAAKRKQS